jgi:5-methylcytosine-specific restriction endonuclease McrA
MASTSRRFTPKERRLLALLSFGKCAVCGRPLDGRYHADHICPFAAGGETSLINGQALCVSCNLHKGATVHEADQGRTKALADRG